MVKYIYCRLIRCYSCFTYLTKICAVDNLVYVSHYYRKKIRAKLVQEIVNDFPTGEINQPFLFKKKRPKVNFFLDFSFKINFIILTLYWVIKWLVLKGKGEKISYYIIWCIKEEIAFQNWDLYLEMILHSKHLYRCEKIRSTVWRSTIVE